MNQEGKTEAKETVNGFSPELKPTGFMRVWKALFHSFEGLGAAFKHEAAFRQEVILALLMIPTALLLPLSVVEKVLLVGVVMLVLITELLNTAVENCIDYISFDKHPSAKRAKDIGSAAVFLSLLTCGMTWLLILVSSFLGW